MEGPGPEDWLNLTWDAVYMVSWGEDRSGMGREPLQRLLAEVFQGFLAPLARNCTGTHTHAVPCALGAPMGTWMTGEGPCRVAATAHISRHIPLPRCPEEPACITWLSRAVEEWFRECAPSHSKPE